MTGTCFFVFQSPPQAFRQAKKLYGWLAKSIATPLAERLAKLLAITISDQNARKK